MKRIALCGIGSENCTFSPDRLGIDDFTIYRGDQLNERYAFAQNSEYANLDVVNLLMARALPGGPIRLDAYNELVAQILAELASQGPWDAVYLDLHGAMYVEGILDAENDFVEKVRSLVGENCLLGASFDLHGNLSRELAQRLTAISAYRTAPHEDEPQTRARTFRLLVDQLLNPAQLYRAWIPIPVLLPGECTSTQYDPGRNLYAKLPALQQQYDLVDISLFVGYAWADEPRSSACVVATGPNLDQCQQAACQVADDYWGAREQFTFGMPALPFGEAIQHAASSLNAPIIISDSGDNPTAGGVGNLIVALAELLNAQPLDKAVVVAGIWDEPATDACLEAGEGSSIKLIIGSTMPSEYGMPLELDVIVRTLHAGDPQAKCIAVIVPKEHPQLEIILTKRRKPFHYRSDFLQLGIVPEQLEILVVKIGYLVPELYQLAKHHWLALTPGAVDQDLCRLPYQHVQGPMFPLHNSFAWNPHSTVATWRICANNGD